MVLPNRLLFVVGEVYKHGESTPFCEQTEASHPPVTKSTIANMQFTSIFLALTSVVAITAAPSASGTINLAVRSDGLFEATNTKRGELTKDGEESCLVRRSDGLFEKRQCGCYCKKSIAIEAVYVKREANLYTRVPYV
jgi:hypothetical protein